MTSGTCRTCRHWNDRAEHVQPITCTLLSQRNGVPGEHGGTLFASPVPGASVRTGAEFGCNQHASRED